MDKQLTLSSIKSWLKKNKKTQDWLAEQINMSPSLLSQVMNQNRKLQTKYLIAISKVIQIPLQELVGERKDDSKQPQIVLRGSLSNEKSKKQINQLLLDIQHCVDLEDTIDD